MPRIVILDAHEANPGDLSWDALAALGDLTIYEKTAPNEVIERLAGAEIAITNKVKIGAEVIAACPDLKFISVLATGYDVIDVAAAKEAGIKVSNVSGYSTASVVQAGLALLLELVNHVGLHSAAVHAGRWSQSSRSPWSMALTPLTELAGRNFLVIGWGAIGSRMGACAEALGMNVKAAQLPGRPASGKIDLDEGLAWADVVSLHVPLKPETRHLMNEETLSLMKPDAILLNLARGAVCDEAAVSEALKSGRLGGFGTDVTSVEPPVADHPLIGAPNCVITPHVAWATKEARTRLIAATAENVRSYLAGAPVNLVG